MVKYQCGKPSCGKKFDSLVDAMIHVIKEHGFGTIFTIEDDKEVDNNGY